ncbi:hypothetical protein TruAng_001028 [Truncatella angustata]|nr:hypothetical protein TruAng_001028 [Truncatella angustata]
MGERGFLIPPCIIWGFSLCCAAFTATKAVKQSWLGFQRGKPVSAYTIMIWAEWSASVTISVISWLFLKGTLAPSIDFLEFRTVFRDLAGKVQTTVPVQHIDGLCLRIFGCTGVIYIQFHPLVYLIKLHIELNMAELIAKIVRATNPMNTTEEDGTQCPREPDVSEPPESDRQPGRHRDSGFASTLQSKEMDLGEQEMRSISVQYHRALQPDLRPYRSTDTGTTLHDHDIDLERGDVRWSRTASASELRQKLPSIPGS